MIIAAGLSPAWQQIVLLDQFAPGEVNRARAVRWCASGKVINVGIALAALGAHGRMVAPLGGAAREPVMRELQQLGVSCGWVLGPTPTRVCTTILDSRQPRATGSWDTAATATTPTETTTTTTTAATATTELVENAQPLTAAELDLFRAAFALETRTASHVVFTGSLPAGTPPSFPRELLEKTAAEAILDIRGPELLDALARRPLVVKPNREELARTVGRNLEDDAALRTAMLELQSKGARWVIITQGARPAWVGHEGQFWMVTPPTVEVRNPIGCGDCLAAGLAASSASGQPPLEAIRFGVACAADNARDLLPSRLDRARIEKLLPQVRVEPWP